MRLLAFVFTLVSFATSSFSQETDKSKQAEFRKQLELTKPGDEHSKLKSLVGEWTVSATARGRDIGKGTASASTIIGDRFLVLDGKLNLNAKTTEFRFTVGFDRRNSEYEITLLDSSGTYSVSARGKQNDKVIRMFGTDNDPFMKKMGIDKKFAFDLKIAGDDEFSITTIYVDNRSKPEKLIPAFVYAFSRKK